MPTKSDLLQRQALPLSAKVSMSKVRIREWYNHFNGDVCVSFSGGKDSTVLAHLVHDLYPDVPLVFSNTGLEYPEIQSFARKMGATFVRPSMRFDEVISKFGYPLISKETAEVITGARNIKNGTKVIHNLGKPTKRDDGYWLNWRRKSLQGVEPFDKGHFKKDKWLALAQETCFMISQHCCGVMKKTPLKAYQHETGRFPYIGTLTDESYRREMAWIKNGCNAYDSKTPSSQPMSFWTEQDVLHYIKENNLEIASVYGDIVAVDASGFNYEPLPGVDCKLKCTGCQRTGCIFCLFGAHLDKGEGRFQALARTHPKQYEYCMSGGQWVDNPKFDPAAPMYDGDWKNWNPKKIWVPSKKGLGMKKVIDDCNAIYGKGFIRYE